MGYLKDVATFLADSGTESKPVGVCKAIEACNTMMRCHASSRAARLGASQSGCGRHLDGVPVNETQSTEQNSM
jgi:hypothetical protein